MIYTFLRALTDIGDTSVTLAFTLVAAVFFLLSEQKKAALAILAAFIGAAIMIALGKITFYSTCGALLRESADLRSPSGHSALSIAVYGVFAALAASSLTGWRRVLPFLCVLPLITLIAISRVRLGYHTSSDVFIGSGVGLMTGFTVWWFYVRGQVVRCRWGLLSLLALTAVAAVYGIHFPAEQMIELIAHYIHGHAHFCVT